MRALGVVMAALAWFGGCDEAPAVKDCGDSLAGVWVMAGADREADREVEGRRYHVLDDGERIEVYPMFDAGRSGSGAAAVRRSPPAFELSRRPRGPSGRRYYRLERNGQICHVNLPAEIRGCADGAVALAWREQAELVWNGCEVTLETEWTEARLERERHAPRQP